jgi:2-C-methyl-D-erythritol 4-phosphate cytidylyltransferase
VEERAAVSHAQVVAIVPIRPGSTAATLRIGDRSVVDRTVRALRAIPSVGRIVLALEAVAAHAWLAAIDGVDELDVVATAPTTGHWAAIQAALAVAPRAEFVLLHDPDRPLVSAAAIGDLLQAASAFEAVTTALPVHGTIKRVSGGRIVETLERESLRSLQTPWIFRREALERVVRRAIDEAWPGDDDLGLALAVGAPLRVVPGDDANVPVRSPADARFAEAGSW